MDHTEHSKPLSEPIHPLNGWATQAVTPQPPHPAPHPHPAHHADPLKISMKWLALCGWMLLIAAVLLTALAQPEAPTYYHRRDNVPLREAWNYQILPSILLICVLAFFISLTGLALNIIKCHVKGDFVHLNFIALFLASLAGILLYLFRFGF